MTLYHASIAPHAADHRTAAHHVKKPVGRRSIISLAIVLAVLCIPVAPGPRAAATTIGVEQSMGDELRFLRSQIAIFQLQHNDVPPGYPDGNRSTAPDEATFIQQLTCFSDECCSTTALPSPRSPYGPYLRQVPLNPVTGAAGVWVVRGDCKDAVPARCGWVYDAASGQLWPNVPGADRARVSSRRY